MSKLKLKKNFWRKLIAMNCAFIIAVVVIFTAIRYRTSISAEKQNVEDLLGQIADANTSEFQRMLDGMAQLSLNITVSNITKNVLKEAVRNTSELNFFDVYRNQRRELIQMMQQMAGMNLLDTSVNIVSAKGDYVLLDVYASLMLNRGQMQTRSKMDVFSTPGTYKFISRIEADPYGRTDTPMFSYVRKVADEFRDYGYVEIQKAQSALDNIFQNPNDNFGIVSLVTMDDALFYTADAKDRDWQDCVPQLVSEGAMQKYVQTRLGGTSYLVYTTKPKDDPFYIYTILPESYYVQLVRQETIILVVQSVLLLLSILFLILLVSRQIYRPVLELREKMEHFQLNNVDMGLELRADADEIETFNYVFANMIERIRRQNDELLEQKMRELEVSYKALQAQVNPHFLHNTLYLIGLKGEAHDAPEILDMCSSLTRMMAYCVDLKKDMVPFSDEIEYMNHYLQLMKYRYLDKLEYALDIEDAVTCLLVPKFILQPLVENCFTHGFRDCAKDRFLVRISIKMQSGQWELLIEDNGNGFSAEDRARVDENIAFVRQSITNPNARFVNQITGIGLINTYARLLIRFPEKIDLTIGGSSMGGGLVKIICSTKRDGKLWKN